MTMQATLPETTQYEDALINHESASQGAIHEFPANAHGELPANGAEQAVIPSLDQSIFRNGILIDLTIGYWSGCAANEAEDFGVEQSAIPGFVVGLGTKRLIPKHIVSRWRAIEREARHLLARHSFPFPIAAARFVPDRILSKIEQRLKGLQRDFTQAVDEFLGSYEVAREDMLNDYPEHRARLEKHYPEIEKLRDKFHFSWSIFSVAVPQRFDKKTQAQLEAEREEIANYHLRLQAQFDSFIQDAVASLRQETVNICNKLATKIANGELITERSLASLRQFIDRFKTLNFAEDQAIESMLDDLRARTLAGHTAEDFRHDEHARAALHDALASVREAASAMSDVGGVAGAYRRKLQF